MDMPKLLSVKWRNDETPLLKQNWYVAGFTPSILLEPM